MEKIDRQTLLELIQVTEPYCVSIYAPTQVEPQNANMNKAVFRQQLRRVERDLQQNGLRSKAISTMLKPAWQLLDESRFWKHQRRCLAAFLTPESMQVFRITEPAQEMTVVSTRFHLKPLLSAVVANRDFYLLSASLNNTRLYLTNKADMSEITGNGLPTSMEEDVSKLDDHQKELQFHTEMPASGAGRQAVFYGTGSRDRDKKNDILRYFQLLDKKISRAVSKEKPLIFAGVDYLFPIYTETCSHPNLVEDFVGGSPESFADHELHERSLNVMDKYLARRQSQAIERFEEISGKNPNSTEIKLEKVVEASVAGRIDTLFVARNMQQWGQVVDPSGKIETRSDAQPGDYDLLDFAAANCIAHGGSVFPIPVNEIPGGLTQAAILRF